MPELSIRTISFRKLVTGPGYSNKAVEATAEVMPGSDPENVLIDLRQWVEKQLGERSYLEDAATVRRELDWLHQQRDDAKRQLADAEIRLRDLRDEIAKNAPDDDDLPF